MEDLIAWLIAKIYLCWKNQTGPFAPFERVVNRSPDSEPEHE